MKLIADNQIIKMLAYHPEEALKVPVLADPNNYLSFFWPSLLECLDLRSLFKGLPSFSPEEPLYKAFLAALLVNQEKEALFYLYDSLFAECLTQVKGLPQIDAAYLLHAIQQKKQEVKAMFPALASYEAALLENASDTMHDLILYLAWDRMCVSVSRLFDYQSSDPAFMHSLEVLKECLIESYLHITQQGRTTPSLYRLLEALFFYEMREENLQKHTAEAWALLSQNIQILRAQDELADFYYIDDAVMPQSGSSAYLTLDSPERVNLRLGLAQHMMEKLKLEVPEWSYEMQIKQVIYLD